MSAGEEARSRPVRALVLSGGGARGAYEAGVLAYVLQELPAKLRQHAPIKVIAGTSVGAVHACFLAGNAQHPDLAVTRLLDAWRRLRIEQTLRMRVVDLLRIPLELRAMFRQEAPGVLLNTTALQELVVRETPWMQIRRNIRAGVLSGLTVSATHIASGKTVVFVDRTGGGVPRWSRDLRVVPMGTRIRPVHAMASAAIPFLFSPIAIDGAYYCDGGIRQNTPLSPALRLGADRALVIGLRYEDDDTEGWPPRLPEDSPQPLLFLGKLLNAMMLDRVDYDLQRLEGFNTILRDGMAAFGSQFVTHLHETAHKIRGASYRHVGTVYIKPSRDISAIATEFIRRHHPHIGGAPGWILSKLAQSDMFARSDIMSYLLFDGRFAEHLIELGMRDADAARDRLIDFLKD